MHKLLSALNYCDTAAELHTAIDLKLIAIESAFSTKLANHETKFTKIVEDKLLNKMVEGFNLKYDNSLLASKI